MRIFGVIFFVFTLIQFSAKGQVSSGAESKFVLENIDYQSNFVIAITAGLSDFDGDAKKYSQWIKWIKEVQLSSIQKYKLPLNPILIENATFSDVYKYSHDPSTVGFILIGHGGEGGVLPSSTIIDSNGDSITTAFLSSNPNIRAVVLASCYSTSTMNALNALLAFGPYTFKISYKWMVTDFYVVRDSVWSVSSYLSSNVMSWKNRQIRNLTPTKTIQLTRQFRCESGFGKKFPKVSIQINEVSVGQFPESHDCKDQQLTFHVPENIFQNERSLLTVRALNVDLNKSWDLGTLTSKTISSLQQVTDHNGHTLGTYFNIYRIKYK